MGRIRVRWLALDWLRAELTTREKVVENGSPQTRAAIRNILAQWQKDAGFAGVRDGDALEKLPPDERAQWRKLWADVEALRKRAGG
jgi:hypothetical protein